MNKPLIAILLLFLACTKENKDIANNGTYHELIEGSKCHLYRLSYFALPNSEGYDEFIKVSKNHYKLINTTKEYTIDSILLVDGSDKLIMSKYKYYDQTDEWGKLFEMSFRNGRSITSDSIVAEYYNTNGRAGRFDYVPDSGIISIKINP